MSLLETVLSAQGGKLLQNLSAANGINPEQALQVISKLVPNISQSVKNNAAKDNGLESLLGALQNGSHERYLNDSNALLNNSARQDGNGILGHIFGNKDVSRSVASQVSAETGIGSSIIKAMLPQAAALVMGALSKQQTSSGGALGQILGMVGGGQRQQASGLLGAFLDRDRDGSILDDVISMAAKRFL